MGETIWNRLDECTRVLAEPFRASEIIGWFRRHYPGVKEQSLRTHIQGATSNVTQESRGLFASRPPLLTRVDRGLYKRFHSDSDAVAMFDTVSPLVRAPAHPSSSVDIEAAVEAYLRARDPSARYTSFDYCFNHFQLHRPAVAAWGEPTGMEVSCLHLGFYLASWGMLRGSSDLLQRSARHLVPLVETVAAAPAEMWDLDLDGY